MAVATPTASTAPRTRRARQNRIKNDLPATDMGNATDTTAAALQVTVDDNSINARIDKDRAKYPSGNLVTYRRYAKGEHDLQLTDKQKEILKGIPTAEFCDNVTHQVLAEDADRLELMGFQVDDKTVQKLLDDFFTKANLADMSSEVHYDAGRDGDHVIALGWDAEADNGAGRCIPYQEEWWDGNEGVFIAYDRKGNAIYGVKEWNEEGLGKRRNVWFDDRVERYLQTENGTTWQPYTVPGEDGPVQPWVKKGTRTVVNPDGTTRQVSIPLHIPYVHFKNPGRGKKHYGFSEIGGGFKGFQDQINDLQWAMSGAGRLTAYQLLTIAGIDLDKVDAEGNPILNPDGSVQQEEVEVGPGQVLSSKDPNTEFGHIPAGSIKELLDLYNQKLKSVARMTRTPLHAITGGDWPSGEALLRAELPAVGKAKTKIKKWRVSWATVAHRMVEITNAYGKRQYNEAAVITAVFAEPERRDIISKATVVNLIKDLLSTQAALRMLGFSEAEIEKIISEKDEAAKKALDNTLAAFDRGNGPGANLPGGRSGGTGGNGTGNDEDTGEE